MQKGGKCQEDKMALILYSLHYGSEYLFAAFRNMSRISLRSLDGFVITASAPNFEK